MTYLEICKAVRLLSGMQGVGPTSTLDQTGVEEVLVYMVQQAYQDIQNMREDFDFLNAEHTFSTTLSTSEYPLATIFQTITPDFKKYDLSSFKITDSNGKISPLRYLERPVGEARYQNSTVEQLPGYFWTDFSDNSLVLKPITNGVYTVSFRYWKNPEILSTDAQVPSLPQSLHPLILYKALEKMSVYLSSPEVFREYALETAKLSGQLMRLGLRKKRLTTGAFV